MKQILGTGFCLMLGLWLLAGCGGNSGSSLQQAPPPPVHPSPCTPPCVEAEYFVEQAALGEITSGPDGNLWFSDGAKIGKITLGGAITEFPIVPPAAQSSSGLLEIAGGPDGNVWFTEWGASNIGKITPNGTATVFSNPSGPALRFITGGPDGNEWFTDFGGPARITPSGTITEFSTGPSLTGGIGITLGPDHNLWYASSHCKVYRFGCHGVSPVIGKLTPGGTATEFSIPNLALQVTDGPDGNLWFTELYADNIGKITPGGAVTEFPIRAHPHTGRFDDGPEIVSGPDGNLWFTEKTENKIARITPAGVITEFSIPTAASGPLGIAVGQDGNLWFAETNASKIGKFRIMPVSK